MSQYYIYLGIEIVIPNAYCIFKIRLGMNICYFSKKKNPKGENSWKLAFYFKTGSKGLKENFPFYLCYYYYVFSNKRTKCMKHVKSISGSFQRGKLWEVNYHYKVVMLLTLVKKKSTFYNNILCLLDILFCTFNEHSTISVT